MSTWTITAATPGESVLPGDFRLSFDGRQLAASLVARRPSDGWGDARPELLARLRDVVSRTRERSKHSARLAELAGQADDLRGKLADFDKQLADLQARRRDPALLTVPDLPKELESINVRESILRQQRQATADALAVLEPHVNREQVSLDAELREAARRHLEQLRRGALARRRQLLADLAAVLGPPLDALARNEAEIAAVLPDQLLNELGLTGGPCEVVHLAGK